MTVPLAPRLDTPAASALRLTLLGRIEQRAPVVLEGGAVERVGLACLQVLAAARAAAVARGLAYRVEGPAEPLADMAALAGLATVLDPA